jgi:hypothetical protein
LLASAYTRQKSLKKRQQKAMDMVDIFGSHSFIIIPSIQSIGNLKKAKEMLEMGLIICRRQRITK